MEKSFIYVYQTVCNVNGKTYVGIHKTDDINDGYIGCGIFGQNDARKKYLFHKAVKKHGYASFTKHILSFYDTYEQAKEDEKYIVDYKWIKSKKNYNTALGGRGSTTKWMCDDNKKKWKSNISEGVMKWMDNGGREKIRVIAKTAIRIKKFGADNVMFGQKSPHRKKILQFNIDGELVKIHESINHAGRVHNTTAGNITSCCKGRYRLCKGYVFRYENYTKEEETKLNYNLIPKDGKKKIIVKENMDGDFICEYSSIYEAAKFTGYSRQTIANCLHGKSKKVKDFIFKYKKEVNLGC